MNRAKDVDRYVENAPEEVRPRLRQIRTAIREAAPEAIESISYGMPHYRFPGESGFESRLCYFGLLKGKKNLVFYTRPAFLEDFENEAGPYSTTKSAVHFPMDRPIPVQLVKKVVKNAVRKHARLRT
jgi:uncharacterized protein YdhG (YjbR/CyaY superfamily)